MARDALRDNAFATDTLGLGRVRKTASFGAPEARHPRYSNGQGAPGTAMTCVPFPNIARRTPGTGEAGTTVFAVPEGALCHLSSNEPGLTTTRIPPIRARHRSRRHCTNTRANRCKAAWRRPPAEPASGV
jgi:glyoxalase family protein